MGGRVNPEESGQPSRRHGLQCPLDWKQVAQWIVLVIFTLYNALLVIPSLDLFPFSISVLAVIFLSNVISQFLASFIDPKEDVVQYGTQEKTVFKKTKENPHVIRNCYCNICKVNVQQKTKHCRACNKCIEVFDHHCDWLNNCIGVKNYKFFFAAVSSAILLCTFVIVTSIIFIVALYSPVLSSSHHPFIDYDTNESLKTSITAVTAVLILIIFIILIFLIQLLALHIKLIKQGKTTYQYIMDKRQKEQAAAKEAELEMNGRTNESFVEKSRNPTQDNSTEQRLKSASTVVTVSDIKPDT